MTPLFVASQQGKLEVVKYLVEVGKAEVDKARNNDGLTPLFMASNKDNLDIVKCLVVVRKSDVNKADAVRMITLIVASHFGPLKVVKYLLEEGKAEVDNVMIDGETLHVSKSKGYEGIVRYLKGKDAKE